MSKQRIPLFLNNPPFSPTPPFLEKIYPYGQISGNQSLYKGGGGRGQGGGGGIRTMKSNTQIAQKLYCISPLRKKILGKLTFVSETVLMTAQINASINFKIFRKFSDIHRKTAAKAFLISSTQQFYFQNQQLSNECSSDGFLLFIYIALLLKLLNICKPILWE